jgi:pyruvate kinase
MNFNKAKIVATLGPASESIEKIRDMANAGVNVFRINFSHGSHDYARTLVSRIRQVDNETDRYNLAILADLQGPKLRIGSVEEGALIEPGDLLTFTNEPCMGSAKKVFMTYQQFARDVKVGENILLDDGKLLLKVKSTDGVSDVVGEVIQGGPLKSKKGVNLPNTRISLPCLTEKDLADLEVVMQEKIEWVGLSFVRSAQDVYELRRILDDFGSNTKIVAKIEKPEAVVDIDNIIEATDGVMVARGDLGVEVPMQGVPLIQKMIVNKSHRAAKPVIIATQMMETMITSMTPTRAEVSDVANSVLDGADALMLSGETSVGKYPVEVIQTMNKIIAHVEETSEIRVKTENPPRYRNERFVTDSICYNASKIADQIGASGILTMTHSGYTAFKISSHRPRTNILVFTANRTILNTLSLLWGVRGFFYDDVSSTDESFANIMKIVAEKGVVRKGDLVVKIASMPIQEMGMTNTLKISHVE